MVIDNNLYECGGVLSDWKDRQANLFWGNKDSVMIREIMYDVPQKRVN